MICKTQTPSQGRIHDFWKGGSILGLYKQKKGGPGGGPTLGPMLKCLYCGPKKGQLKNQGKY